MPGESREYVVARYLEIEIAISRQLSYLRLIQDKAFLKTMVIIITIYYYSLRLNTRGAASAARGRIRLVWGKKAAKYWGTSLLAGSLENPRSKVSKGTEG